MKQFILTLSVFWLFACNQSNSTSSETTNTTTTPPPTATTAATLPSLPMETLQYLWQNCDYIDYLFYQLPISISLHEQGSIQYALRHIASDPAVVKPECQAIGRIFYQVKGENAMEADIFFQQGCTYFVFYKDGKKAYANYMTDEGIKYLNSNIERSNQMQQQQSGGQ